MSKNKATSIGVLDIQGSVEEHFVALKKCGVAAVLVKTAGDLEKINGLIIPGGESTTIGKLLKLDGLDKKIVERIRAKKLSVWGSCAGAILLAKNVSNHRPDILEVMDISIERNAYGGQLESFETAVSLLGKSIPAIFIRAPHVKKTSAKVEILAQYQGTPVMVRQENLLATMFHPELTGDLTVHRYFISLVQQYAKK